MLNKIILMGRLCADPDFRQTQSQISVCRIRVAVNRPTKKDEEQQADFINVTCWRQTAEFVSRYFSKGSMIIVEGSLRNNDYTDSNGVKHYSMDVLAQNVTFGESRKAAEGSTAAPNPATQAPNPYQNQYQTATRPPQPQNSPLYGSMPAQGNNYYAQQPMPQTAAPAQQGGGYPAQNQLGNLDDYETVLSDGEVPF